MPVWARRWAALPIAPNWALCVPCGANIVRINLRGRLLSMLPTEAEYVICGPGENAGVIAIDDTRAAIFKMESHNHPSNIEPYQGAATGVGGILRDIFTMGARPVAIMNALRFGAPQQKETKNLLAGVVDGIADYGNCFGVPNLGGEMEFDPRYRHNILVNAMAVGIADRDKIFYSNPQQSGLALIYLGAKTGRDGIDGAAMASRSFQFVEGQSANETDLRPTIQVGDPFTGKCLLEACLRLMESGAIIAIQDMGAAGAYLFVGRDGGERKFGGLRLILTLFLAARKP